MIIVLLLFAVDSARLRSDADTFFSCRSLRCIAWRYNLGSWPVSEKSPLPAWDLDGGMTKTN
jgi:hypothetical protein